jgi:hypothetical protein
MEEVNPFHKEMCEKRACLVSAYSTKQQTTLNMLIGKPNNKCLNMPH